MCSFRGMIIVSDRLNADPPDGITTYTIEITAFDDEDGSKVLLLNLAVLGHHFHFQPHCILCCHLLCIILAIIGVHIYLIPISEK